MTLKKLWYALCSPCRPHTSRTVRLAFPLVIIAAIFAGTAAVVTQEESYITITTNPVSVTEGETFYLDVIATVHTPVNAVNIVVDYPETQMNITSIDTGESVITLWAQEPYDEDGKIHLTGGVHNRGFIGEHKIARIRAIATQSGIAHVITDQVRFIAGDGTGNDIAVGSNDTDEARVYIVTKDGVMEGDITVKIITDVNGDGRVDFKDISAFMAAWFDKNTIYDFNGDGKMSFRDFSIILAKAFFN